MEAGKEAKEILSFKEFADVIRPTFYHNILKRDYTRLIETSKILDGFTIDQDRKGVVSKIKLIKSRWLERIPKIEELLTKKSAINPAILTQIYGRS
jgi:hypothetical protein